MQGRLIGGTPYAKNTLGTVADFANKVNSTQLLRFYHTWYHPNNAVYIITGDVDPAQTIAEVRRLFGDIPVSQTSRARTGASAADQSRALSR